MTINNILLRSRKKKAREFLQAGKLGEAKIILEQICKIEQTDPGNWGMLGAIFGNQGLHSKAADCFKKANTIQPNNAQINYNLGIALRNSGDYKGAVTAFLKTTQLKPDFGDADACLAHAYSELGMLDESIAAYRQALRRQPNKAELHANLGNTMELKGLHTEAVACCKMALQINPDLPAYENLGNSLSNQGEFHEALAAYREGLRRNPNSVTVYSNLLSTLNYIPESSPKAIYEKHKDWGRIHGHSSGHANKHAVSSNLNKPLQIGYVSPDFRANHSVTYFIEPILRSHNKERFEIYCYSMMPRPDGTTKRLQKYADHWRNIFGWDDERLANQIIADKVDILVDLAGHTAHNSLTTFARKPAPIQITYLGYPNTTGLPAIDYRLTDAVADPEGEDAFYTEKLTRLPGCFLCYQPPEDAPPVNPLPAVEAGHITFGSFNNLTKVNEEVVKLWSRVLKALPGSRLLIKQRALNDPETRKRYSRMFESQGIGSERIELLGHIKDRTGHLALYGKVDIALDTFPYNGTTTTCEALWMGVPVMTLVGNTHAGRVGNSLINCIGLDQWIARNADEYIDRLTNLAGDTNKLAASRCNLRKLMTASALCNYGAFTENLEDAYHEIWRNHCEPGKSGQE